MAGKTHRLQAAIGAALFMATLGTIGSSTAGASNPPLVIDDFGEIHLEPSIVTAGGTVTINSSGCFDDVVILVDTPTPIYLEADPAANGAWSTTVTIPATTPAGKYDVGAVCDAYYDSFEYTFTELTVLAPAALSATANPSTIEAGKTTVVTGTGFTPNENVNAVLNSTPVALGTFKADASGKVVATVTIPASTARGAHTIVLTGVASGRTASAAVTVTGIPVTGSNTGRDAAVAIAVLALGLVALGASFQLPLRRTA